MNGCAQATIGIFALVSLLVLVWMIVPTEQTVGADFPNVMFLIGFGDQGLEPISHDNVSLDAISASDAKWLNGIYQFDPFFYHKSLDRFIPWEARQSATIFSCFLFCSPMNTTAKDVRLALVHTTPQEKKNLWYLLELRDDDPNSPIVYARSKFRKLVTYRSPWITVTPGGEIKPKDLPNVYIFTAWDAFRFDTPLKWGCTAAIVLGTVLLFRYWKDDD